MLFVNHKNKKMKMKMMMMKKKKAALVAAASSHGKIRDSRGASCTLLVLLVSSWSGWSQ